MYGIKVNFVKSKVSKRHVHDEIAILQAVRYFCLYPKSLDLDLKNWAHQKGKRNGRAQNAHVSIPWNHR